MIFCTTVRYFRIRISPSYVGFDWCIILYYNMLVIANKITKKMAERSRHEAREDFNVSIFRPSTEDRRMGLDGYSIPNDCHNNDNNITNNNNNNNG